MFIDICYNNNWSSNTFINRLFQCILIILFTLINLKFQNRNYFVPKVFAYYKHYINDIHNLKKYKRTLIKEYFPYVSICLPVYNMENYIEKAILSILNQSFQNFEIIIVNDYSNDTTKDIIKRLQLKDNRIKIINHQKNLGVYTSRVDGILASRGKFIILMDPDDIFLNPKLLEELYAYNLKYNLDIIEFTVICYIEKNNNYKIIKNYWVIWNKIIRRKVLLNAIFYIGIDYYKKYFITAEDILINLICLHFSQNYSNINLPGYLYNIRQISMTHGMSNIKKRKLFYYNHLLYLKKLYIYIKDFNKNRNFLYYEIIEINKLLIKLSKFSKLYENEIRKFYIEITKDKYVPERLKEDLKKFYNFL